MAAAETPQEIRRRRIEKKEAKGRRRREKDGWDKDYLEYTNTNNPFGDNTLQQKFVWEKKLQQEASSLKLSKKELEKRERFRQEEFKTELEKVKKLKQKREMEKEAREEERMLLQRMNEADKFKEWEAQEDQFHLHQAKLRSKIRIESGRAKPIDVLAKYITSTEEEELDIEVQEPYLLLRGLNIVDLEDLLEDIKVYREIEMDVNGEFWSDMVVICKDEISKLRKLEESNSRGGARGAQQRGGINAAVAEDVNAVFKGKTHKQLQLLESQINTKVHSSDPGTDVGYWESLLQQLQAYMARARLRDRHQELLRKKLFFLKQQQLTQEDPTGEGTSDDPPLFPSGHQEDDHGKEEKEEERVSSSKTSDGAGPSEGSGGGGADTLIDEDELLRGALEAYKSGGYSPRLVKHGDVDEGDLVDPEEDDASRSHHRQLVLSGGVVKEFQSISMTRSTGEDGETKEEYDFNSEVNLGHQAPIWREKYKPRKPRFFNRVHTGFEWNKYNQTHYDTDNPPPKIVQGYKFNIFFSDLIDKRKTPQYKLTPCADNSDFAILRFTAGPPYEDIAFKIVNREWECSWRHGFRSQFSNNILQLWFRFKRNRYRR